MSLKEYRIKDIRIKELLKYINSDEYKNLETIPISYHRAISYINNPRADEEDLAITLLYMNQKLIAYRCLYSDYILKNNNKEKFAWISGSWVHPEYRRQGYSAKLLDYCLLHTSGRLMFSNYAQESKALYDKSKQFNEVSALKGIRFYFRFSSSELLPPKHSFFKKISPILHFSDTILNFFFDVRFLIKKIKINSIHYKETVSVCNETKLFIEQHNIKNPFSRSKLEINHAKAYPWVLDAVEKEKKDNRYYFSSYAKRFEYKNITFYNENNIVSAFLLLKVRDNTLTIPYVFFEKNALFDMIRFISHFIKTNKISLLTCFNETVNKELLKQNRFIMFKRKMNRSFFAQNALANLFSPTECFFDGEGDNLYT